LTAYQQAPEITRERLYLETLESVLSRVSKVLVDVKGTNNLLYLPLDRLLKSSEAPSAGDVRTTGGSLLETLPASSSTSVDGSAAATRLRDLNRSREVR